MNKYFIRGIQQIGIGVSNIEESFAWYRKYFGADIKVFDDDSVAEFMLPYTGNKPQRRRAILAMNLQSGGGFEIWQYKGRIPQPPISEIQIGDLGIFAAKIKSKNIEISHSFFKQNNLNITEIIRDPRGNPIFWVKDPWGNNFQIIEGEGWFADEKKHSGLTYGAIIGVPDIEKSFTVYKDILGYSTELYSKEGRFEDLQPIAGGNSVFKRVLLSHPEKREGCFGKLLGPSQIELVQVLDREPKKILEGRYWGDLGFIHLCFDIANMDVLRDVCKNADHPFTIDSYEAQGGESFDMGESAGLFSYIEDNGGTLIEFVEGHRLPIVKRLKWEINLKDRAPQKPLPTWIIKALRFSRVKN